MSVDSFKVKLVKMQSTVSFYIHVHTHTHTHKHSLETCVNVVLYVWPGYRFGHGAFLVCLEALYRKISGHDLHYTSLVGKPCEITYRFAEHTISKIAKRMGITKPIKRLYFFG